MESGLIYLIIFIILLILVIAGSIKRGFHPTKFFLSIIAIFFTPGLIAAFGKGVLMLFSTNTIWVPVLVGLAIGIILYEIIFKRLFGFSTFEHELSHAIIAILFFRKITKFVVTRYNGGYIEHSEGFGGKVGNHFISLGPYFLPTFTLISILIRPFLPGTWFPWFDIWIGITFSYQTMNNIDELKGNWSKNWFRIAGTGDYSETDIGKEGYIFSFIMITALKLLLISMLMYIMTSDYSILFEWLRIIWKQSINFFQPIFTEMYYYVRNL